MWWQWWQEALVPSLPGHHLHQGLMDTVLGHYDSIRAILDELNCQAHGHIQSDIRIVAFRQWLVQCFRPGLQHCMTQVVLIWLLSLSLGWPDEETVLIRWGNTHFRAPSSPRQEAMDSLYVHCYLAADTHVVDSIKNLSSSMHTWLKLMAPGRKYHSKVEFARWSYCWWDRWTHLDLTEIYGGSQSAVPLGPWPWQCLQRAALHCHPLAQGPHAGGWHAPGQQNAQWENYEAGPQELGHSLGGRPHASNEYRSSPCSIGQ